MIKCQKCGYTGHGFKYIELVSNISEVDVCNDGVLRVRLDRAELRYDEIQPASDRFECPKCRRQFDIPEGVAVVCTRRPIPAAA